MLSVAEATAKILSHTIQTTKTTTCAIEDVYDEVLGQAIVADRDYPPFDRVMMDGIGVRWQQQKQFPIEGIQRAGIASLTLEHDENCFEVMTGAVLPQGCDTVIRYEDLAIAEGVAVLNEGVAITLGQCIHRQGSDCLEGQTLIASGTMMNSTRWAIAASVGIAEPCVLKRPEIAVISTGDELVSVRKTPDAHQIRQSNPHALISSLRAWGYHRVSRYHLADDRAAIVKAMKDIIDVYDVVILSGGVSMGKFDYIPEALEELRVKKVFHKVAQKPGKPLWFGVREGGLVFGLPGNPVSAIVCLHRYVLPALQKTYEGHEPPTRPHVLLDEAITTVSGLTSFVAVKLRYQKDGTCHAVPVLTNNSGDFTTLADSDGFIEVSHGKGEAGAPYPLYGWRPEIMSSMPHS